MEEGNYSGYENEIEIDLIDLIWELVMQWKPIAVCMLLCGCLLMPLMYVKNAHSYNASIEETEKSKELIARLENEAEDTADEEEEEEDILTEAEWNAVNSLVLTYRQLLDAQKRYNATVSYRIDPYHRRSLTIYYQLHTDDKSMLFMLRNLYASCFSNSKVYEKMADAYGMSDITEVRQLFSFGGGDASTTLEGSTDLLMSASATLLDDTDVKAVSECMQSVIKDYKEQAQRLAGAHTMTYISEDVSEYFDTATLDARTLAEQSMAGLKSTINSTLLSFTDVQKQVFEYLKEQVDEEYDDLEQAPDTDFVAMTGIEDVSGIDEELVPATMSPKYFLLGMILGAFLYAGVYVVWWVLSPRIRQVGDLTGTMGVRAIGELRAYPGKTAMQRFFRDPWVYGLRYKKKLDTAEALRDIRERISLMPEGEGDLLFIVPTALTDWQQGFVDRMVADSGRTIGIVGPSEADTVSLEERLASHPQVILVSSAGKTAYRYAGKLFGACRTYGAALYGHILIEAV